jgi:D-glycerate 3-kinase
MLAAGERLELSDAFLTAAIASVRRSLTRDCVLVGISGPQGCGKSTTVARLATRLRAGGLTTAVLSIDDVYLTRDERRRLSAQVHPLLATRGVPGTHDIGLLETTLDALASAGPDCAVPLPAFDKIADDRRARAEWPVHRGRAEVVLLEGWCVAARAQPGEALRAPCNELERDEDPDGRWRAYVNARLADDYARLFARVDFTVLLRAPDFSIVHRWRDEQEERLASAEGRQRSMDAAAIARFIAHYERLTRWQMQSGGFDLTVQLDNARAPVAWRLTQD